MLKQRLYDSEKKEDTKMKMWWYDGKNTIVWMVRWWNCDGIMMKTLYYFLHRVIASSWFHHRAIVVSSSWRRVFIIVLSRFYHIVPSCIAVQKSEGCEIIKQYDLFLYSATNAFQHFNCSRLVIRLIATLISNPMFIWLK
jgi:hypothetical protein